MIKTSYALFVSFLSLILLTFCFQNIMDENYTERNMLRQKVLELEEQCGLEYINKISYQVTVTTYNPTPSQTDSTPNQTADGTIIKPWLATNYRYVALSRDLLSRWGGPFDYGDYVVIEGTGKYDGVYQVRDTMNPKWVKRVDILRTPGSRQFKYKNITLTKYGTEDNDNLAWRN